MLGKKISDVPDLINLPKPKPGRTGGAKLALAALLALLLVGGAAFWLTRDTETKDRLREQAAGAVDDAVSGTPLAGVGDVLREGPPPPPLTVTAPVTMPGTLAGQNVQGSASGGQQAGADAQSASAPLPYVAPKVTSDSRIRPDFVEDLAAYLVSRYKPGPRGGTLAVSVQGLNQRYGVKMPGMADEGRGGRAAVLRYAFHPSMLQGLYSLYAERFMESLAREAQQPHEGKALTPEQTRQLYMALAGRLVMTAGGLEGVAAVPELRKKVQAMDALAQSAVEAGAQMSTAVFEVDQLRERSAPAAQIDAAAARVESLSTGYRRALEDRSAAQRALAADIRKGGGQGLDEDALLFLGLWVDRRLRDDPQALAAVNTAAGILRDLARRCAQAGTGAQPAISAGNQVPAPMQPTQMQPTQMQPARMQPGLPASAANAAQAAPADNGTQLRLPAQPAPSQAVPQAAPPAARQAVPGTAPVPVGGQGR